MWTAISLWLVVGGGALAYVAWAIAQVGGGAPAWPFVVGLPLVYVALILFNTTIFFALAWWFRAQRPEHARIDGLRTMRMVWDEFRTMAGSGAADDAVRAAGARPGARPGSAAGAAAPRRAVQRRRVDRDEAPARRRGPGSRLRAVLRPAARVDRALRRPGRRQGRRDSRRDRRAGG